MQGPGLLVPPTVQEALQELVDHTFKRVLTRDRVPDDVGVLCK